MRGDDNSALSSLKKVGRVKQNLRASFAEGRHRGDEEKCEREAIYRGWKVDKPSRPSRMIEKQDESV